MSELNITRDDLADHLIFKGRPQQFRCKIKLGNELYVQSAVYQNFRSVERLNLGNCSLFSLNTFDISGNCKSHDKDPWFYLRCK